MIVRRLRVERDGETVATGVLLPSKTVVVEWDPTAFPEGERTDDPTQSIYGSVDDAIEATGGEIVVIDDVEDITGVDA